MAPCSCLHRGGDGVDAGLDQLDLAVGRDERDHHLGHHRGAGVAVDGDRRLEDGAGLHVVDRRHGHAEADAAHAEHRVDLGELAGAGGDLGLRKAHGLGERLDFLGLLRQELVQRRVEQADGHRQAAHDLEELDEVGALHRQELVERGAALGVGVGEDHLAHHGDPLGGEEHVLAAAEAEAVDAELAGHARLGGGVGVGADPEVADGVRPVEQLGEGAAELGRDHLRRARRGPRRGCRRG